MIQHVVEQWHAYMKGQLPNGLDDLLDDDCVFLSPIVFSPQKGKDLTKLYLMAASQTLPGEKNGSADPSAPKDDSKKFRYTKEVISGNNAVLEFETYVEGKYVNGVDIITCNDAGKIIEFRVMIRPLQAVNLVHQQMGAMLEKMK